MDVLEYYRTHGPLTDPGDFAPLLDPLPNDAPALLSITQGLLRHDHYGPLLYGPARQSTAGNLRMTLPVDRRLQFVIEASSAPLSVARQPEDRSVGTCRDFALMICAMLRQHGKAARVRCGFARYFDSPGFEDHWVCEYWDPIDEQWILVDAQLDAAHRRHLDISFDPARVPADQFLFAWQAWDLARANTVPAAQFRNGGAGGMWLVCVNLARDLWALRKRETSSWDRWRDTPANMRKDGTAFTTFGASLACAARDLGGASPKCSIETLVERPSVPSPPWV